MRYRAPGRLRLAVLVGTILLFTLAAQGAPQATQPGINISLQGLSSPGGLAAPLQLILLFTLLTLAPALLLSMTCFTRILIILHFLRQALGTQNMPSNQILIGLTLFLTIFIMGPVSQTVWTQAVSPAIDGQINLTQAFDRASVPLKEFMSHYTREQDIAIFTQAANLPRPANLTEVPMKVMVPAFMISELKTAFQIGLVLFIPFLIIDIIVSSILLALGMFQLPPIIISTPFKLLLFVMVDGWNLVMHSLVKSFF